MRARTLLATGTLALACASPAAPTAHAPDTPDAPDAPDASILRPAAPDAAIAIDRAAAPDRGAEDAATPDASSARPDASADAAATDASASACRGTLLQEPFEGPGDRGWTHAPLETKLGDPWVRGAARNPTCHQGSGCWTTSLDGAYATCQEAGLASPVVDLGGCAAGATVRVSWWQWMSFEPFAEGTYFDSGLVQISRDGGATWAYLPAPGPEPAYVGTCGTHDDGCGSPLPFVRGQRVWSDQKMAAWREAHFDVPAAYLTRQFRVRFVFASDFKMVSRGWLIDDLTIAAP